MMFGSAPIAFQGSSLKVHWLKASRTVMYSHVFSAPVQNSANGGSSNPQWKHQSDLLGTGYNGSSYYNHHPSGSDLSSMDTSSLRSFTVTSSTSTQHDTSYNHRQRPPLPLEFGHVDRLMGPRLSSNSGVDSGYGGTDPWGLSTNSSRHPLSSHRSSLASICSDFECFRRLSIDTTFDIPPAMFGTSLEDCSEYGSLHRRFSKNVSTSFENRTTVADHVGHVDELNQVGSTSTSSQVAASDSCVGGKHRRNSETMELTRRKAFSGEVLSTTTNYHGKPPSKKARLGVALCIQINGIAMQEMETFCSEHITIFESMLCRLRVSAEKACHKWPQFLQIMLAAWHFTQQWLMDFFTTPRLVHPVWITLSSSPGATGAQNSTHSNRTTLAIANNFMNDLCSLLSLADTKDTNLFISTLLTAVLTHHLGWVSTIAPMTGSTADDRHSDTIQRKKAELSKITANKPYNVLWAQLGDLYGAVGHPVKLSKTIICGSSQLSNTIEKILNVLSYFIRCSEIKRTVHIEVFEENSVNEAFATQKNVNSCELHKVGNTRTEIKPTKLRRTGSGLIRSATRTKDLTALNNDAVAPMDGELSALLKKNVMNDIPNVLVYRDSRFVQQELRIGNKCMDTELRMNAKEKQFLEMIYHIKKGSDGSAIRMTLTQPDETGQEAIELDDNDTDDVQSVRLSKLITENNIGESERRQKLLWGLERVKEGISLEQLKYIDGLRGDYKVLMENKPKEDVVFVLGDDEQLVNIKHTGQTGHTKHHSKANELGAVGGKKPCSHSKLRKHSVIFDFDRYPKVFENYLKSQNLDLTEYDFLEKGMKLEMALKFNPETEFSSFPDPAEEECDVCKNASLFSLQTPTNASELEFSSDLNEESDFSSSHASTSRSSIEEELRNYSGNHPHDNIPRALTKAMATLEENAELKIKHPDSILKLVDIPLSKFVNPVNLNDENNNDKTDKVSKFPDAVGFVPSLFSLVCDRYMPDMILQGTTAPPATWDKQLNKELLFASRFALVEQYPVENLAVVANLETHDVRVVSSHMSSLPPSNPNGDLVGMSQLVSSMLETVHAMWSSGLSSFQCMAFIESKLREFYLQSETIASFLLATDFCTIGSITAALDITANDMPLLLSVASIHSPEVTKRYGIQFR
ncbi:uncharacterized protein LOC129769352 isoform X2 [Toxorhynchites rutilus septentrionalis]|nr:uncharacterized protein LOC129769352 isoform X2 [Toxorhynchites rutilus septentrionalis]